MCKHGRDLARGFAFIADERLKVCDSDARESGDLGPLSRGCTERRRCDHVSRCWRGRLGLKSLDLCAPTSARSRFHVRTDGASTLHEPPFRVGRPNRSLER